MDNKLEELKFVADLARSGGVMEAQNAALLADNARLQTELNEVKVQSLEKDEVIADLKRRNAELEAERQQGAPQQPTMVVNNFFVLSEQKVVSYIGALDNNGRFFAGHFLHHTLTDGTPAKMLAKVDEITSLQADVNRELADAIKEAAEKPTTTVNAANYNAHVEDQHNNYPELPPMVPTKELPEDE